MSFANMATNLYISEIVYKDDGNVHVQFGDNTASSVNLRWSDKENINVYDRAGNKVKAQVPQRGKDSLELFVPFARPHEIYTFEITNVSYAGDAAVALFGYFFTMPGWKLEYTEPVRVRRQVSPQGRHEFLFISDVRYHANGSVTLTFGLRGGKPAIAWDKMERVAVEGRYGRFYRVLSKEYTADGLTARIDGLLSGESYFIEIRGIPYGGERIALGTEFVADEEWQYQFDASN